MVEAWQLNSPAWAFFFRLDWYIFQLRFHKCCGTFTSHHCHMIGSFSAENRFYTGQYTPENYHGPQNILVSEQDCCWSILVFGDVFFIASRNVHDSQQTHPPNRWIFVSPHIFLGWDDTPRPKKKNLQGQLLTSDNYDDNEKKVVGGRNGQGPEIWKKSPDMVSLGEDVALHGGFQGSRIEERDFFVGAKVVVTYAYAYEFGKLQNTVPFLVVAPHFELQHFLFRTFW